MSDALMFDYFYGIEADRYTFYRIPKVLIKHPRFKSLSSDAKIAYGLMLDRMSLSIRNRWIDDHNRTFIIYTLEQIAFDLGCSQDKATRVLAALDSKQGIGLIERVRRGLGKPDIIYVKNFVAVSGMDEDEYIEEEMDTPEYENTVGEEDEKEAQNPYSSTDSAKCGFKKPQNTDSEIRKVRIQETAEYGFRKPQNTDSGNRKIRIQESAECGSINNDINNTDFNDTEMSENDHINLSRGGKVSLKEKLNRTDRQTDEDEPYIHIIQDNIEYNYHMKHDTYSEKRLFTEIYELICDIVCVKRKTVRIEGEELPYEVVKSRFLKLKESHVLYVMERMKATSTKINNIKSYLRTALYNAPVTIDHYYQQQDQYENYDVGQDGGELR